MFGVSHQRLALTLGVRVEYLDFILHIIIVEFGVPICWANGHDYTLDRVGRLSFGC